MSWICGTPGLSESSTTVPQILLCHYCDFVLLGVILLFVEVDQFLVQQLIEHFVILETSLDIDLFPEPILSSADVVQRTLDSVVAKRPPRFVLESSVLYVSRVLAHIASKLQRQRPLPKASR